MRDSCVDACLGAGMHVCVHTMCVVVTRHMHMTCLILPAAPERRAPFTALIV